MKIQNRKQLHQRGFTSAEMVVSAAIMAILGIVFLNVLNSGMLLYTKNTAVNSAHEEARAGINLMTRDIHAAISVPQLRTPDAASLLPSDTTSIVSSIPTGSSAPMAAGVSFQDVALGPQYVWKDPSGNGPIMVKGTYNTPEAPTVGMHFVAPLYNVEDDIVKVTATPTQANHHNVFVANGGESLVANKASLFGASGATYSIIYYTTRIMYMVKNGRYIPDSNGPFTLTVGTYSSGTAQRYVLQNGSYLPSATGTYTVRWEGTGDQVDLKIYQGKNVVISAPARVVKIQGKSANNSAVLQNNPDGSSTVSEIRFGGKDFALQLSSDASGAGSASGAAR